MSGKGAQKRKSTERLSSAAAFTRIFAQGRRVRGGEVNLLFFQRRDAQASRWGIAISRKFGNAVKRNRVRRVTRELVREKKASFPVGYDLVVEFLTAAKELKRRELRERIENLLAKCAPRLYRGS